MKKLLAGIMTIGLFYILVSCEGNTAVKSDNSVQAKAVRPVPKFQKNRKYDPEIYPIFSDLYTGGANLDEDSKIFIWNGCTFFPMTGYKGNEAPEGKEYLKVTVGKGAAWFGWAVQVIPDGQQTDMSYFRNGKFRVFIKATNDVTLFKIGVKSGYSTESWIAVNEGTYGFKYDNQWHEIVIPLEDFKPSIKINAVTIFFMFAQQTTPPKAGSVYYVDGIAWMAAEPVNRTNQ